jgi:hypothetical protein
LELSDRLVTVVFVVKHSTEVVSAMTYALDAQPDWHSVIQQIHSKLNIPAYFSFDLIHNFSQTVMLPLAYNGENRGSEALDLIYGPNPNAEVFSGEFLSTQSVVAWRIPHELNKALSDFFPPPDSVKHSFQQLGHEPLDKPSLRCTVYPDQISVSLFGRSGLLFAGYLNYESETDIMYHIFTLLEKYSFLPEEVSMKLNGLVTQESSLFIRLHQYIGELEFDVLSDQNWKKDAFDVYPLHFFTHLIPHLQCGS